MNNNPIGVFDSGVGGLTILKTLLECFHKESFIYFADTKNSPYGIKTEQEIQYLSKNIIDFLLLKKCKAIIVACNTATSCAIYYLRKNYDIPIIGIEPAIKPASLLTKTKNIGVLATQGTIKGGHFKSTSKKVPKNINIINQVGIGLVKLIEENKIDSPEMNILLNKYILPMVEKNVDYIVLGCTHYPLLKEKINKITKGKATLIEPSLAVAKHTKTILHNKKLFGNNNNRKSTVYTSGNNIKLIRSVLNKLEIKNIEIKFD